MILKASQRGGGQDLATHLMNTHANERMEILDVRGTVARDLHGAFAEWQAASTATNCKKYIYSLSISPDPAQRNLSRAELDDYIARIEKRLGLEGQSRAVVVHVKEGREHYHAVWSRIDTEQLRAVQIYRDHIRLQEITKQFAKERGLRLPEKMRDDNRKDRFKDRDKRVSHAEKQQEERTGVTKEERRRDITDCWKRSDTAASFTAALEEKGYYLAQGDKRGYVVVDRYGEIHSLSRQIEGVKARDISARLPAPDKLRSIPEARQLSARKYAPRVREEFKLQADTRRADLEKMQKHRRATLNKKMEALAARHKRERDALIEKHMAQNAPPEPPTGLAGFLGRITGITKIIKARQRKKDALRMARQNKALIARERRHTREIQEFMRQMRALARVEKREIRSLHTALRREERLRERSLEITRRRQEKKRDFAQAAQEIVTPPPKEKTPERTETQREDSKAPDFNKAASPVPEKVLENLRKIAANRNRKGRGRDRSGPG